MRRRNRRIIAMIGFFSILVLFVEKRHKQHTNRKLNNSLKTSNSHAFTKLYLYFFQYKWSQLIQIKFYLQIIIIIIQNGHMILQLKKFFCTSAAHRALSLFQYYSLCLQNHYGKANQHKRNTIPWNYFHAWNSIEFYSKIYTATIKMETLSILETSLYYELIKKVALVCIK